VIKFHSPSYEGGTAHAPANAPGVRHLAFVVEDIDAMVVRLRARGAELVGEVVRYGDSYRLCYVAARKESSSSSRRRSPKGSRNTLMSVRGRRPLRLRKRKRPARIDRHGGCVVTVSEKVS
jgi:glyoxalase/bleomycin resistance protein/dioxygenase superfamily protein